MKSKLENPKRVAELSPKNTLERIGLGENDTFCDVGAGTGIFTFAATKITKGKVYAVEKSEEMLAILEKSTKDMNAQNITIVNDIKMMPKSSCKIVLLCTVLHEVSDVPGIMNDIAGILIKGGILSIIEFHKHQTPMGPPIEHRLDSLELDEIIRNYELYKTNQFTLGDNFYCSVFKLDEER
ncbi:MAG: methyltransferase domain-containing protein [Eubacteriales bacterium]|nr:methyltransferase domain-containing protein [Eubacteriales bacterium]MDD4565929.1 methyltransferase domain-containing protein [Eubacteriales bacterium]